ncbi:MAG TPA: flagellar export chaperone FliS [Bryobacteraceae bacterium]|nr:flagellar export chaperone FliS [Bryobacteraceae bacterium]
MYANAKDAYLESKVLSASPVELIRILYESAASAIQEARRCLAEKRILERSRSITRACAILAELISSLDRERGGEVARRLAELYGYMHARLLEANHRQEDAPLAEVLGLFHTLAEAWEGAVDAPRPAEDAQPQAAEPAKAETLETPAAPAAPPAPADYGAWSYGGNAWAHAPAPDPAPSCGGHAWSF